LGGLEAKKEKREIAKKVKRITTAVKKYEKTAKGRPYFTGGTRLARRSKGGVEREKEYVNSKKIGLKGSIRAEGLDSDLYGLQGG